MLTLFETVSAVEFGVNQGLFNIDHRDDYLRILFELLSKGDETQEEGEALEEARRILSQSPAYNADSFNADAQSFNPSRYRCGGLIKAAKKAGWVKPKLTDEQKQEKHRRQVEAADPSRLSPYFVDEKGHDENPYNAAVRDDGTTLVGLINYVGETVGYWGIYQTDDGWDKRMLTQYNDGFWCNFYPVGYVKEAGTYNFESYFLEQPTCPENTGLVYKTKVVLLAESIANCMAIEAALKDEGRGNLITSQEWALFGALPFRVEVSVI